MKIRRSELSRSTLAACLTSLAVATSTDRVAAQAPSDTTGTEASDAPPSPAGTEKRADPSDEGAASSDEDAAASGERASETATEPEGPATRRAREAFRLGSALAAQGQWSDALAAFQRAQRLRPHPVTTYNIGYVQRALGHLTRARKALKEALDGGLPADLHQEAQSYLSEIEPKLARIAVTITSDETTVAVDGRPLEVESTGARPVLVAGTLPPGAGTPPPSETFDLLVDPGAHMFVLSREGAKDRVVNQSFEPGAMLGLQLGIRLEKKAPKAAPVPVADTAAPEPQPSGPSRWPVWVAYGVGGAGLVTGSVLGGLAIGKKKDLDAVCEQKNACPEEEQGNIDDLDRFALGSNIAFAVGAAGVTAGTVLLFVLDDDTGESPVTAELGPVRTEPWVGVGSAGLRGEF